LTGTAREDFKGEYSAVRVSGKGHDPLENRVAAEERKQHSKALGSKEICTSIGTGHGNPKNGRP
jgi:hypothetical protein